jgi:hypothetical protein
MSLLAYESLILAEKVPEVIRRRVLQGPDVFRRWALLDGEALGCSKTSKTCQNEQTAPQGCSKSGVNSVKATGPS